QTRLQSISSLYQLINSSVSIPSSQPNQPPTIMQSPLNNQSALEQYLPILLDKCTTTQATEMPARININTAPEPILSNLPAPPEPADHAIAANRPQPSPREPPEPVYATPAWLIVRANLSPQTLQTLDRYITARSQVYRVQSIGYFDGGGPVCRVEAV